MRLQDFLAQNTSSQSVPTGSNIFHAGGQAECAFYIESGQVEIFKTFDNGEEAGMAVLEDGQIFGEMALLRYDEYTLSARAKSDTVLRIITPELLQEQVKNTHPLIKAILDMLIDRMHGVNETLIDIDRSMRG